MELSSVIYASLDGMGVRGRMDTCICMAESLHCSPETTTTLLIGLSQNKKKFFKLKKKNVLHSEWYIAAAVKSPQSCPTLCNPIDSSPPGSPVPGILQATILEWVAIPFSRGSSWPRGWTWVSCTADRLSLSHQGTPWWCIVTSNKRPHVPHSQS